MRFLRLIQFALVALAILPACRDNVIVEPPPPLEGTYEGTYQWEKAGQPVEEQAIIWIFTPTTCLMDLDTTQQTERLFCDIEARYTLSDGIDIWVLLIPGKDSSYFMNRTRQSCDRFKGPWGKFQLDQSVPNRVVMTRNNVADTVIQRIILFRTSDEY